MGFKMLTDSTPGCNNLQLPSEKQHRQYKDVSVSNSELTSITELTSNPSASISSEDYPSQQPTLTVILAAIQKLEEDMNSRFNALDSKLEQVQTSLTDHAARIADLEGCATDHESRITVLEKRCEKLTEINKATKHKLIDLESRSRRSNIKISGLPEKAEKGNPTQFMAEFLPQLLGINNFPSGLKVDRVHHIGAQPSSARLRTMIAKLHHFLEKEKILKLARLQTPLSFNGTRISNYPDFSPEIMEQRRAFDGVKKKLRDAGIKHGLIFPARLIFTFGSEQKTFQDPADAETYIDRFINVAAATALQRT
uniref:L1 transposable element RRM domain-containing protein n=1 Tax=Sander lucioperca TaxID=283035 RepID=A0A8C9ZAX5_SANLU